MVKLLKRIVLKGIRSAGYELRHNPLHGLGQGNTSRPRKPQPPVVEVLPVTEIPCPVIDLGQLLNPLPDIMQAPEFPATVAFFANNPAASRSLVSPDTQALLFTLIRNLRAKYVVEIGSFRCGTAEAICRALHANGAGRLFTVDPFGAATVPQILSWWPPELQRHVSFIHANSADFYMEMEKQGHRPELVFVDGNHDYEFALFDIQCAAVASRNFDRKATVGIGDVRQAVEHIRDANATIIWESACPTGVRDVRPVVSTVGALLDGRIPVNAAVDGPAAAQHVNVVRIGRRTGHILR